MKAKKLLKLTAKAAAVIAGALLLGCAGLYLNNQIRLYAESPLTEPLGKIADVSGQQISVYTEGSGVHTLVFLQGGAYPSPILEAKSLYTKLSDTYRIAVIERPGYGFSPESDEIMPLEQELELEREALTQLGIEAPYILVPHSASGIESILWAGKYPDEVEAIVGLDMSVPEYYQTLYDLDEIAAERNRSHLFTEMQMCLMKELGVVRFYDIDTLLDSFRTGDLTEQDKAIYKVVAYKIYFNKTMTEGMLSLAEDMQAVERVTVPELPMLLFISDGTQLGLDDPSEWIGMQERFAAAHHAGTVQLACGHSMQNIEQERIAAEMKAFIGKLNENGA